MDKISAIKPQPVAGGDPAQAAGSLSPEMQGALLEFMQQLQMQSDLQLQQMVGQSQGVVDAITGGVGSPMDPTGSLLFANGPLGSMTGGADPLLNNQANQAMGMLGGGFANPLGGLVGSRSPF